MGAAVTTGTQPDGVSAGRLFAIPYQWARPDESPAQVNERNRVILDHLCAHPMWFAAGLPPEELRATSAWLLTHPQHRLWEVWLGGKMVGMLALSRITPGVDCLLHYTMWGCSLLSARALLQNFLGHVFDTLGLQRISFEVPEHVKGLVGFMRNRLGFRYEGEALCEKHPAVVYLKSPKSGRLHMPDAELFIARQGSRRESSHWDGTRFRDMLLLRLIKSEYDVAARSLSTESRGTPDSPPQESSGEPRLEARAVPALHSP